MKSLLAISAVLAISPDTSTFAVGPKKTPLGLTITTVPLAVRLPWIDEGFTSLTRLRVSDDEDGWLNVVVSFEAILNERQSMMALLVDWLTVSWLPEEVIFACPAETTPPCGLACTFTGPKAIPIAAARASTREDNAVLRVHSLACLVIIPVVIFAIVSFGIRRRMLIFSALL